MMSNLDLLTLEMREKIAELAEECEVWHTYEDCDRCEVDIEAFAKLIIQEYVPQKQESLSENVVDNCLAKAIKDGWYPINEDSYRQGFWDGVYALRNITI